MLPRKVQEAAERAEALHKELYGNTAPAAPVEPVAAAPEVVPEPVAPVATEPVAAAPAPVEADPWEKKYRVLEGKYNAEVPRMAAQLRDMKDTIQSLEERLAAAPAPVAQPALPVDVGGMTPEDVVEQFGEDFAKAVGAVAARIAQDNAQALRNEFKPQLESVERNTKESARASFMRDLSTLVPDWQQIDTDEGFTAYLDEVDQLSGRTRRFFFNEADKNNDATRIAKFFLGFKGNSTPVATPAAPAGPSAIDIALQPSTNRTTTVPPGKRFWTSADVRQFYVDVRKGRYTPQDAHRIESDIFAAQRENRFQAA